MNKSLYILLAAVLAALLVLTGCKKETKTGDVKTMTGEELQKIQNDDKEREKYLVIDVRSNDEYRQGHVRHAINIPVDELKANEDLFSDYKNNNTIVTICNTGKKSAKAAEILKEMGYDNVVNAAGVKDFQYDCIVTYSTIRAKTFFELFDKGGLQVVDSRDKKDFDAGHLKGAVNILPDEMEAHLGDFDKTKPIYNHCYVGARSAQEAELESKNGFEAYNVFDGTNESKEFESRFEK